MSSCTSCSVSETIINSKILLKTSRQKSNALFVGFDEDDLGRECRGVRMVLSNDDAVVAFASFRCLSIETIKVQ
jgi:hypothetical protein